MEVTGAPAVSTCWFQCSESTYVPIFWTSQLRHKDVARKKTEEVWTLLGTSHSKTAQAFLLVHFRETQKDWFPPEPAPRLQRLHPHVDMAPAVYACEDFIPFLSHARTLEDYWDSSRMLATH